MTVKELIECLSCFDGEMDVLVDGYEAGCDSLQPNKIYAVFTIRKNWWLQYMDHNGEYDVIDEKKANEWGYEGKIRLILSRKKE
jgi:hypothetical protein